MKIVKASDVTAVNFTGGESKRIVIKSDNMGFGICETHVRQGGPYHWHYKQHLEACYCVSGLAIVTDLKTGAWHKIEPGTTYVLNNHDDHTFDALTDVVLISVFNPPLTGMETHDEDGSYSI